MQTVIFLTIRLINHSKNSCCLTQIMYYHARVTLLGTLVGVQDYKKVKFPGRDNSSLAVKGLRYDILLNQFQLNLY